MPEQLLVVAPYLFERVREDRQSVKRTIRVDALSQRDDGGRQPCGIDSYRLKRVAHEVAQSLTHRRNQLKSERSTPPERWILSDT